MNKFNEQTEISETEREDSLFPIRTVATITGVNPNTLRAWERRYGLIKPKRTDTGHRLYTQEHIDLIQRVTELLEKGIPISQVEQKLHGELPMEAAEQANPPGAVQQSAQWQIYQRRMFNAVLQFDPSALDHVYNETLSLYPIDLVTQHLIIPVLKQLGERWRTESGAIAEEHFFGIYLRNKLGARFHHHTAQNHGPILVVACLPGEMHELGLMLFGLAALDVGFRVVLLGANLPLRELHVPVSRAHAAAAVLSGSAALDAERFAADLSEVTQRLKVPVFIGGYAAVRYHDEIVAAQATPLGNDFTAALKRIAAMVGFSL